MTGRREVKVVISGDATGGASAFHKLDQAGTHSAQHAEGVGSKIGGAFNKAGSMISGEFGEIVSKIGEGIETINQKGRSIGKGLMAAGGAVTAVGAALQAAGSKDKQAAQQLAVAIDDTGRAASDYREEIEATIKKQEDYGHSAADTQEALTALTLATQDPKKALEDMGVVANLAAAKHESLSEAGVQVAKVYGGAGRVLKQYGITLESSKAAEAAVTTAQKQRQAASDQLAKAQKRLSDLEEVDRGKKKLSVSQEIQLRNAREDVAKASENLKAKTEHLNEAQKEAKKATGGADEALEKLNKRLSGQAAASVDTFSGRLDVWRTKLGDWAAEVGNKYGPAITATGPLLLTAGLAVDIYTSRVQRAALAQAAQAAEAQASAAAVVAADEEMAAGAVVAGESSSLALGPIGIAVGVVGGGLLLAAHHFGMFGHSAKDQVAPVQSLTDAILQDNDALGKLSQTQVNNMLQSKGAYDAALKLGVSQGTVLASALGNARAQRTLAAAVNTAENAYTKATETTRVWDEKSNVWIVTQHKATQQQKDAKKAADQLGGAISEMGGQLEASRRAADNQTAATKGLSSALHHVPNKVVTKVEVTGVGPAKQQIRSIFDYVNGQVAVVHVVTRSSSGAISGGRQVFNAAGTDYFQGGQTHINEAGPELIDLPRGSAIHNRFASADMLAAAAAEGARRALVSGGGSTLPDHITIDLRMDGRVIQRELLQVKRENGGRSLGLD